MNGFELVIHHGIMEFETEQEKSLHSLRQKKIHDLLKSIETGDPEAISVVNEKKYIQHNPQTHEGGEGLVQLFSRLAKTYPKIEIVRIFEDGDYVFGHTIYEFSSVRIGFEVFRYEGDHVVEHWDTTEHVPPLDEWKNDNGKF